MNPACFVVATPGRSVCDENARALEEIGRLRFIALATRRGTKGVSSNHTRLNVPLGLTIYLAGRILSPFRAESFRFALHPRFDRWVKRQLSPGDHIISSYGYANECFKWVRQHGGKTFVDAGNSHPDQFWDVLSEEQARWESPYPPIAHHWIERARAMMSHVDYVLSPSAHVTNSFLHRGFRPEQILSNIYPIDLSRFSPPTRPRPRNRRFTLISTGALSLRKGTPYLLEAFRIICRKIPDARLLLTTQIRDCVKPILERYRDLPIEWASTLPHPALAQRLRSADIFVLPSLEEGLARSSLEALACGLPIIVTPHTGSNDFVKPGVNGEIIPIRNAARLAEAILSWREKILATSWEPRPLLDVERFSFESFARHFLRQLEEIGLSDPGE